jgi:hypothetical protein
LAIAADLTELYSDLASLRSSMITAQLLMRSKASVACNGTAGQVIAFSSEFASVYSLRINDFDGIGIEVTAKDQHGFTIKSLSSGFFGYEALIEV